MATRELPLDPTDHAAKFKLDLDGRVFEFVFKFNARVNRWHLDILSDAGVELINGVLVVVKLDLLAKHRHDERLPQGTLFAVNLVSENVEATQDNLGSDVLVLYDEAS